MLDLIYYLAIITGIVTLGIAAHTEKEVGIFYDVWWPPIVWVFTVIAVPAVVQLKAVELFDLKLTWWESAFVLELTATIIAWTDVFYKRWRWLVQEPIVGVATVGGTLVTFAFGAVAAYAHYF